MNKSHVVCFRVHHQNRMRTSATCIFGARVALRQCLNTLLQTKVHCNCFWIAGWNGRGLGSHALAGPLHSIQVESRLWDMLASISAQVLWSLLRLLSEHSDRLNPSTSPCRVQVCFIWNSRHVGRVILPLWLWVSTDNVVNDIPYCPACPKFPDKYRSKFYRTWAGRLANVSHTMYLLKIQL